MKAALKGYIKLVRQGAVQLTDAEKQDFGEGIRYCRANLGEPWEQDGQLFHYIVAPFKLIEGSNFKQEGAGVLCQTEEEAKEACETLDKRNKKHLVVVQWAGAGLLGWISNMRRFITEIGVMCKTFPNGKKLWVVYKRETDQDTLEVKLIYKKETDSEGEANFWADKWSKELDNNKKSGLDSTKSAVTQPPPPHCTALTKSDIEDLGKAKMIALKKQWPRCFGIFDRQRSDPNTTIPDQQIEDAYLLDLVGNGNDLWSAAGGKKIRPDMQLVSSLHKAAQNYALRGKSKIIDAAIYLIAFNWELGWCYFSDDQLAQKLGEILETSFTAEQVEKYRYRTLGLMAKLSPVTSKPASRGRIKTGHSEVIYSYRGF